MPRSHKVHFQKPQSRKLSIKVFESSPKPIETIPMQNKEKILCQQCFAAQPHSLATLAWHAKLFGHRIHLHICPFLKKQLVSYSLVTPLYRRFEANSGRNREQQCATAAAAAMCTAMCTAAAAAAKQQQCVQQCVQQQSSMTGTR